MHRFPVIAATLVSTLAGPAQAALDVGDKAPDFSVDASLAGNVYRFHLMDELK
jgi:hypothetical protein